MLSTTLFPLNYGSEGPRPDAYPQRKYAPLNRELGSVSSDSPPQPLR